MMARQTLLFGNSVWRIVVNRGVPALYPVSTFESQWRRGPCVSWRYQRGIIAANRETPKQRNIPSEGIVHCRIGADGGAPWLGVSPLARAGVTAEQLAYIEARLRDDCQGASAGYLMPVPGGVRP